MEGLLINMVSLRGKAMPENLLLSALPGDVREKIEPKLQKVNVGKGEMVLRPGVTPSTVLFPANCIVSLVTEVESGGAVEAGMVGYEGFVGLSALLRGDSLNIKGVVQVEGEAESLPTEVFRHHLQDERFRDLMGRHAEFLFTLASQSVACQAYHSVEQRLARWLLMVHERLQSEQLPLTQEFLASMLGVQRPTVTVTARLLQSAELISYRHGKIRLLDVAGLKDLACDCYPVGRVQRMAELIELP
jgi:CRP-like cAMP-binding protein